MRICINCKSPKICKKGFSYHANFKEQRWFCNDCKKSFFTRLLEFKKDVSPERRMQQRYLDYGIKKIGYVDIETDGQLKADFGNVITAVIMIRDIMTNKRTLHKFKVTKKEIIYDYDSDKRIIEKLFAKMSECDLVIGHYFNGWKKFDMPFLRSRAQQLKIKIPNYGYLIYGDTWNMAHSVLQIQSYSLDGVCRGLGIKSHKTRFDAWAWRTSRQGMLKEWNKAIDTIMVHNVYDVIDTYRIHYILEKMCPVPIAKF